MTSLKNITTLDFLHSDKYQSQFYAYDNVKKENCILILPNVKTSWIYSIEY